MRLQDLLASICLSTVLYHTVNSDRVSCPKVSLRNGRVKLRARGKMAYFKCKKRFTRLGDKFAVCLQSGKWSHAVPTCISKGCPSLGALPNIEVTESYDGAMLKFRCPVGTKRNGPETITCNGRAWSDKAPFCESGLTLSCDFEKEGLCGWSQDETDNFDWTRKSGQTPTMHTGPQGDHTTGSGHYMFIESSSPRKVGDVARLISPIYPNTLKNTCFAFWYHMKGPGDENDVGSLEVYVKPETAALGDIDSEFFMEGHQGDDWIRGFFKIPNQDENFQIIIVGTRKEGFVSDIALDDLRMYNCSEESTTMATTKALTTLQRKRTQAPTTVVTMKRTTVPDTPTTRPIDSTTSTTTSKTTSAPTTRIPTTQRPKRRTTIAYVTTPMKKTRRPTMATRNMKKTTTTTPMPKTTVNRRRTKFPKSTPLVTKRTTPTTASQTKRRRPRKTTTKSVTKYTTTTMSPSPKPEVTTVFDKEHPSSEISNVSTKNPRVDAKGASITTMSSQASSHEKPSTKFSDMILISSTLDTNSTNNVTTENSNIIVTARPKETKRSTDKSASILPLVIGITAGIVVGMIVIGILAWMWARSQRKKKEREAAEDEMYMLSTGETAAYNFK